jgi:hypothetical protein
MDFGESVRIWAVMTQGNGTAFVTSYTLATSRDNVAFTDYTEGGVLRVRSKAPFHETVARS